MAITSVDSALAGMRPPVYMAKQLASGLVTARPLSTFYLPGSLGAAAVVNSSPVGVALTSASGQIPVPAVFNNTHLARFSGVCSSQPGLLLLCDRLWHNSGILSTAVTAQTVNSVAFPPRDSEGTVNGTQVLLGVELLSNMGVGTPAFTVNYTNSAGVANRMGTNLVATGASASTGGFFPIGLDVGDTGVRSVQSIQLSATWTSGTLQLVAYRVVAALELPSAGIANAVDVLTSGMPRLYNGSVPFLQFTPSSTATGVLSSTLVFTQG